MVPEVWCDECQNREGPGDEESLTAMRARLNSQGWSCWLNGQGDLCLDCACDHGRSES